MVQKFLVLKGMEGWGDRFQCLLQAIGYCIKTGRTLVIDWRDPHWYHDSSNEILNYLGIKNVDVLSVRDFCRLYKDGSDGGGTPSVVPAAWSGEKMTDRRYWEYIYQTKYHLKPKNSILFDITNDGCPDFKEDIVVSPGVSNRSWQYAQSSNVEYSHEILDLVKKALDGVGKTGGGEYNVLHLRAGTKPWMNGGGRHPCKAPRDKLSRMYPNKTTFLRYLQCKLAKVDPRNEVPLLICSDDEQLTQDWLAMSGGLGRPVETTHCKVDKESGIHLLKKLPHTNKHQLNLEAIRDFLIMCNAEHVIHDEVSIFSVMAEKCTGTV